MMRCRCGGLIKHTKRETVSTHKEGVVLEGGGLRSALAVDRHSSLKDRGFTQVSKGQSQVFDIEGTKRGTKCLFVCLFKLGDLLVKTMFLHKEAGSHKPSRGCF